ncbi:MAG: NUDIX hydrolase [archaeon]
MDYKKPSVTADIIVINEDKVLLVKRKNNPYQGYWALPGGFLDTGKETVKQTAQRELNEETGLRVKLEDLQLVGESSHPNRDPRGHIVSLHYLAQNCKGELKAGDDANLTRFFPLGDLPRLAFDHEKILRKLYTRNSGNYFFSPARIMLVEG